MSTTTEGWINNEKFSLSFCLSFFRRLPFNRKSRGLWRVRRDSNGDHNYRPLEISACNGLNAIFMSSARCWFKENCGREGSARHVHRHVSGKRRWCFIKFSRVLSSSLSREMGKFSLHIFIFTRLWINFIVDSFFLHKLRRFRAFQHENFFRLRSGQLTTTLTLESLATFAS